MGLLAAFQATLMRVAATVKRALTFPDGESAVLTTAIPQFGPDWTISFRIRNTLNRGSYVWRFVDTLDDALCLYHYADGRFAFFSAVFNVAMYFDVLVTDFDFHAIVIKYRPGAAGQPGVLSATIDGVQAAAPQAIPDFLPGPFPGLAFAVRNGEVRWLGTVDYFWLDLGATRLLEFNCDEPAGNPQNSGTLGGELQLYGSSGGPRMEPTRELVP